MSQHTISTAALHYALIRHILDHGYAPEVPALSALFQADEAEVVRALHQLQADHGVVLHPHRPKVWVIHPFSLAPTNFVVASAGGAWWGNCAWCSLGVAALVGQEVTITTTLGADGRQVSVHILDGRVVEDHYLVHFPVPMRQAWDNVIYTCSTMLLFEMELDIDRWSEQHRIPKGDVQPVTKVWDFAQAWYGNHLNPAWKKWTAEEARSLFRRFGLTGPVWHVPVSAERF
jgi:hypothetical protein